MTKREEEFLDWLLDPQFGGDRVPGSTKKDLSLISRALRLLRRVTPGLVTARIADLEGDKKQLEDEIQSKRTVFRSRIQTRSHDSRENIEQTERLFLATLIARKHSTAPYEFLFRRFVAPPFNSAKAIQMRVRRFEQRLEPSGPVSCAWIAQREYSQFLSLRRQKRLLSILSRYRMRQINYAEYRKESNRLMMPSPQESRWLTSLFVYANAPA